ncbi:YiiG family protein [Paraburkholderia sediminicola]|uniref:YiiG family protein n=1 Tax=Paraburkholderia sediminicola TaxID=458836 RepID=UPI0038BC1F20
MSAQPPWYFTLLGIDPTPDVRSIKRAYAVELKKIDQERQREAFERLRGAYELALAWNDAEDEDNEAEDEAKPVAPPVRVEARVLEPQVSATTPVMVAHSPFAPGSVPPRTDADAVNANAIDLRTAAVQEQAALDEWVRRLCVPGLDAATRMLDAALSDLRLIHLDAKSRLEARVLEYLRHGDGPNADLFDAAADRFDWRGDALRFGTADANGLWVAAVLNQEALWKQQTLHARGNQLQAVQLATRRAPDSGQLLEHWPSLSTIAQNFPDWLRLRLPQESFDAWQAAYEKACGSSIFRFRKRYADIRAKRSVRPVKKWQRVAALSVCVVVTALRLLAQHHPSSFAPVNTNSSSAPLAPEVNTSAASPVSASGENGPEQKLELYIECYNRLDGRAHSTISRYSNWVTNMTAGPSGRESHVYGLYQINSEAIRSCAKKFAQAAGLAPAMSGLDAAANVYIQSLDALSGVVQEAYTYYDREDYKDDNFARGKQLHPRLAERMRAFLPASRRFSEELDRQNDPVLEARMQRIEKEQGRKLPYLQTATMLEARRLVRLIENDTFDAGKAAAQLQAYEGRLDALQAYTAAHEEEVSESAWHKFQRMSEKFLKAAKERTRRVRDRIHYSDGERMFLKPGSGWMVHGSPENVVAAYNELVTANHPGRVVTVVGPGAVE